MTVLPLGALEERLARVVPAPAESRQEGSERMPDLEKRRTAHLTFHRPRPENLEDYLRLHSDPVVTATLGGPRTLEQTRDLLGRTLAHWDTHGFGWWILRDPSLRLDGEITWADLPHVLYRVRRGEWGLSSGTSAG